MTTGAQVVAAARTHLGTPWMHQGRLPGAALDCAGLVICVGRQLGMCAADFDINAYGRNPDGTMIAFCEHYMQRIGQPELGAVLVMAVEHDPQHLGFVGDYRHGGWSLIHAAARAGRVIETRLMWARNQTLRGVFRLPGVVGVE